MGTKEPRKSDRRVQRTRRMLRDALLELIGERGWDPISVQDICDRADVGRSTFYIHFADKEDLLLSGYDDLRKELRRQLVAGRSGGVPLGFTMGMITHARDNLKLFRALFGKKSGHAAEKLFRTLVVELVREDLAGAAPPGPKLEAAVRYLAGAFLEMLTWWLDSRTALSPEELNERFLQLSEPVLARLRAGK